MNLRRLALAALAVLGVATISNAVPENELVGEVKADGSSTVYLITEAVTKQFKQAHPRVNISVGISGTGGGFKKFAAGETDISDASRPIKPQEAANCKANGIEYDEFQVAWDGLSVVIHPENTWARKMTMEQLKKIWHPDIAAKRWSDVDPSWPNEEIKLYGAGPDSGTFDFFTEAVNGKEKVTRKDYSPTENDEVTVKGVAGNKYAMGYFGVAYYIENKDKLAIVQIRNEKSGEFVEPNVQSVMSKTYVLSRPLFIYVKKSSMKRPEVQEFVTFYLRRGDLARTAGYVPLNNRQQFEQQKKLQAVLQAAK